MAASNPLKLTNDNTTSEPKVSITFRDKCMACPSVSL